MKNLDKQNVQEYLQRYTVDKTEGAKITGQSQGGFDQSVKLGLIIPFFEIKHGQRATIRLYHIEDLKEYAKTKRQINKK
ncbi:hypothetical protein A5819_003592 [Enterococcus sp. 7E2_DIV0204]|nr:hypothetical protein [Enterococcus sp. 7E2_DIV0204]OTN84042.1 hypothetical protein A5819_003592 [Enterococcus sp. 7E2_DIV0204]OTP47270.1 hypothetical protein A5884_003645 [Enterococcus sp. 7D2_DIV0200]